MTSSALSLSISVSIVAALLPTGASFSLDITVRDIRPVTFAMPLFVGPKGFGNTPKSTKKKEKGAKEYVYTPDTSDKTKCLLEWLDKEEVEGLEGAEIGFADASDGTRLRGVFAKQDFSRGDYIIAVPFVSTLLIKEDFEATNNNPEDLLLASEPENGFLFWQNFLCKNDNSHYDKYSAYLDCLPMSREDPHFDETPDFWSDAEIERIQIPSLIRQIQSRKKAIQDLAASYDRDTLDQSLSLDELQQACWILQTRGFTTFKKAINLNGEEGMLSRVILIPFVDFVNHGSNIRNDPDYASNAILEVVETKEYDESFYALVASRTIRKGEEIRICYGTGNETSPELFAKYGFIPAKNEQNDKSMLPDLLKGVSWHDFACVDDHTSDSKPDREMSVLQSLMKQYVASDL